VKALAIKRTLLRYLPAALFAVGVVELALHFYFAGRAPRFDDYARLVDPVAQLAKPGELVVTAPRWAEPMTRRALGEGVMPTRQMARPDEDADETALEISILGRRDAALADWRELAREVHGPFVLRRLQNPRSRPTVFDFTSALDPKRTRVSRVWSRATAACPWTQTAARAGGLGGHPTFPSARFQCRGGVMFNVSETVIADQDFRARRCIWAHPPRSGELRITFADVPLGETIVGHGGMYWLIERERAGTPVKLAVRVDGEAVGEYLHRDGDGWSRFEIPLGKHAGATAATVEFAVSSDDHRRRHFCFEAHSQ
jgi:hypothetical protein